MRFLADAWHLAVPYWQSEERWRARLLFALIHGLALALVFILVQLNEWNRNFYNALQNRDFTAFGPLLLQFALYATFYIIGAVYKLYLTQMLEIRWREWMTRRFLGNWLDQRVYYRLELEPRGTDNPDQRIADDLRLFTTTTLELTVGLVSAGVTLVSFVVILFSISGDLTLGWLTVPGYMVWAALAYALGGSLLARIIGRPLIGLNFQYQRNEADFRVGLVRVREQAEGIALYRGEAVERAGLFGSFERIRMTWWELMESTKRLMFFSVGYNQAAVIFPILVAAPRYFAGEIDLGGLMQIANAFGQVQGSLSWFIDNYPNLASWKASTDRLLTFESGIHYAMEAARYPELGTASSATDSVHSEGLDLRLPTGRVLLADASFRLERGERALLSGPNGSGKSTLFRAIANIWPYGDGVIFTPDASRMLFLPQRPYHPVATLRAAVSYPSAVGTFSDDEIQAALQAVGLARFADQLDEAANWGSRLSIGEQQRLAFARVILHRPDWIFLDEATAGLDEDGECMLYRLLQQELPRSSVVSIAHRSQLSVFHTTHISIATPATPGLPGRIMRSDTDGEVQTR
jgi:putative ATP-binding cassette transporter